MFNSFSTNISTLGIAVNDHASVIAFVNSYKGKITVEETVCGNLENLVCHLNQIKKQKYQHIVFSVDDSKSILKKIILDNEIKEKNIQKYLHDNQAQLFPGIKDDLIFDFEIIESSETQQCIQVNAIIKSHYEQIIDYCIENKIKPKRIEFYSDSLIRLINNKSKNNKVRLFIGYNYFIIFQNNRIIFSDIVNRNLVYYVSSFLLQCSNYQIEEIMIHDSMKEDKEVRDLSRKLSLSIEKLAFDKKDLFNVIAIGAALLGFCDG